jgi:alginate O-acetyltransferase complex protein AlgI
MLNFYVNLWFFLQVSVAVVLFRLSATVLPAWGRQVLLLGFSAYFLSLLAGAASFRLLFLGYIVAAVAIGQLIARTDGRFRSALVGGACTLAVAVLVVYKYAYVLALFQPAAPLATRLQAIHWIGLSYLTFRAIDYLVAVRLTKGLLDRPWTNWLYATSYLSFFPAYISGPINRFAPYFAEQVKAPTAMSFRRLRDNVLRASLGVVKMLFLGKIARAFSLVAPELQGSSPLYLDELAIALYIYYLYLYFDFSGYCDVAIALADFFDVRLPENFHYPFLASSPQDFWNRWHITLSHWMRDMVFFRLLRVIFLRFPRVPQLAASLMSAFITFTLMGAWHGNRPNWVLYGCYHGFGLSTHMLYRWLMERFFPDLYLRLFDSWLYRAIATFATFNFIAWGLLLTQPLDIVHGFLERLTLSFLFPTTFPLLWSGANA